MSIEARRGLNPRAIGPSGKAPSTGLVRAFAFVAAPLFCVGQGFGTDLRGADEFGQERDELPHGTSDPGLFATPYNRPFGGHLGGKGSGQLGTKAVFHGLSQ